MTPIPARFLTHVGTVAYLRCYVTGEDCACPVKGYHDAMVELGRSRVVHDEYLGGMDASHPIESYPTTCACGYVFGDGTRRHILRRRLLVTAQGEEVTWEDVQPGDLFFLNTDCDKDHYCHGGWSNCDGKHLHCVLPGGHHWDIDGRASNCTMREDTTHRCWVRHGDPEHGIIHVDKNGLTCRAGAGSIVVPEFHGFLHNNMLVSC
jgi:hypothetical protein